MVGHWRERESELLAGIRADAENAGLTTYESNFLREVGRLEAALTLGRQAAAPRPVSANRDSTLLIALAETGRSEEAASLSDTAVHHWPTHPAAWSARLQTFLQQARWTETLALFRPDAYHPLAMGEDERRAWTAALKAMSANDAAGKHQAVAMLAAVPEQQSSASMLPHLVNSPADRIGMIAILGDNDAAFAKAAEYLKPDSPADSSFLFWPDLVAFRRDERFWPFVSRIGLVDYWRATGKWPDFCSERGLPYSCKT